MLNYAELYQRYQAGQSLRQIEHDSGVPYHVLYYQFHKLGYTLRTDSEAVMARYDNTGETERMYADYCGGMSCVEVGDKYFYSGPTVWKRFRHHGLTSRKRGQRAEGI